jgi:hypothetical protein
MDALRDKMELEHLWQTSNAKWKYGKLFSAIFFLQREKKYLLRVTPVLKVHGFVPVFILQVRR